MALNDQHERRKRQRSDDDPYEGFEHARRLALGTASGISQINFRGSHRSDMKAPNKRRIGELKARFSSPVVRDHDRPAVSPAFSHRQSGGSGNMPATSAAVTTRISRSPSPDPLAAIHHILFPTKQNERTSELAPHGRVDPPSTNQVSSSTGKFSNTTPGVIMTRFDSPEDEVEIIALDPQTGGTSRTSEARVALPRGRLIGSDSSSELSSPPPNSPKQVPPPAAQTATRSPAPQLGSLHSAAPLRDDHGDPTLSGVAQHMSLHASEDSVSRPSTSKAVEPRQTIPIPAPSARTTISPRPVETEGGGSGPASTLQQGSQERPTTCQLTETSCLARQAEFDDRRSQRRHERRMSKLNLRRKLKECEADARAEERQANMLAAQYAHELEMKRLDIQALELQLRLKSMAESVSPLIRGFGGVGNGGTWTRPLGEGREASVDL